MIIVKLDGGMGNQLFQYALGKYLSVKLKAVLKLDRDRYLNNKQRQYSLDHFNMKPTFSTVHEKKRLKRKEYLRRKFARIGFPIQAYWCTEEYPGYHDYVQQLTDNVYLEGFWQSEKYFKPIENIIRSEFVIKTPPSAMNARYMERIHSVNAVAVHIRRGDYVSDSVTNAVHGVCDTSYYSEAVTRMASEVRNPSFFIFSDDMRWTMENVVITHYPATYVDHNTDAAHEDLRLMYSCKHHIIANSSFSWWGAWLNDSAEKKVIAPKQWFRSIITNNDIIPEGWQTI